MGLVGASVMAQVVQRTVPCLSTTWKDADDGKCYRLKFSCPEGTTCFPTYDATTLVATAGCKDASGVVVAGSGSVKELRPKSACNKNLDILTGVDPGTD